MSTFRLPSIPARGSFAARALGTAALVAATAGGVVASTGTAHAAGTLSYNLVTLDNSNDLSFNQLLGINDQGVIAGYFGSGMADHPNKGYYLLPGRYSQLNYRVENFPGSTQTQVTGLNNGSVQVGFQSPTDTGTDPDYGWYSLDNGRSFTQVDIPLPSGFSPDSVPVTQFMGVNDHDVAVGFENDSNGNAHGFVYSLRSGQGQVAGFFAPASGSSQSTEGFLTTGHGVVTLAFPGASSTMALGVNNNDEVVGVYTTGSGSSTQNFGFTWAQRGGFTTVDDPNGMGATTVNGVNDRGDLVGFYVDGNGNTDGMLVTPSNQPLSITTNPTNTLTGTASTL
jgi:hypothetical protein